mmetsp:Transcript_73436/g.192575  ORF Transcript_73436/g.192575 Transcript_73436/m.192575 type:complete len:293 (+) Transcript_73436:823-1701(+)
MREVHDPVHDLQLVPLLQPEDAGHELPLLEDERGADRAVLATWLWARVGVDLVVELEGAPCVAARRREARLHVVAGPVRLQLRGAGRMARSAGEDDDAVAGEVVGLLRGDDSLLFVVVALEDGVHGHVVVVQPRVDAHDRPELGEVVAALVVLAEAVVEDRRDRRRDGRESAQHKLDQRRELRSDPQLPAPREDRGGDDLAEEEDEGHGHDHRQPGGYDLVQEERQGLVGQRVHEEEGHQQPVVVLDQRKDAVCGKLVLLQLLPVELVHHVLLLGLHDDLHLHGLDRDHAHC